MMLDLTGWRLDEARAHLQTVAPQWTINIIETAPPRPREGDTMGELRVLRQRTLRQRAQENEVELLVAREQIGEARTASEVRTAKS